MATWLIPASAKNPKWETNRLRLPVGWTLTQYIIKLCLSRVQLLSIVLFDSLASIEITPSWHLGSEAKVDPEWLCQRDSHQHIQGSLSKWGSFAILKESHGSGDCVYRLSTSNVLHNPNVSDQTLSLRPPPVITFLCLKLSPPDHLQSCRQTHTLLLLPHHMINTISNLWGEGFRSYLSPQNVTDLPYALSFLLHIRKVYLIHIICSCFSFSFNASGVLISVPSPHVTKRFFTSSSSSVAPLSTSVTLCSSSTSNTYYLSSSSTSSSSPSPISQASSSSHDCTRKQTNIITWLLQTSNFFKKSV